MGEEDRVPTCTSKILEGRSGGQVGLSCSRQGTRHAAASRWFAFFTVFFLDAGASQPPGRHEAGLFAAQSAEHSAKLATMPKKQKSPAARQTWRSVALEEESLRFAESGGFLSLEEIEQPLYDPAQPF